MPVGYMEDAQPFHTSKIELQKNDLIYTFTDGFADQFGGPKGKKFKYSQLKLMLTSLSNQSLKDQQYALNHTFEEWKGSLEQVDDVCVVGFKL
jgi:serine phosphatase RsbU (regulator of sigma subunit)